MPGVDRGYLAFHAPRFRFVLDLAEQYLPAQAGRVLDIGLSPLSEVLRRRLPCPVDTLGLEPQNLAGAGRVHYHADLNQPDSLPSGLPAYDLVVFAEVLEHLHTSPALVLPAVGRLLAQNGVLILQTPNAASLPKRIKLLIGRNPYELIRPQSNNPGHFREYTLAELRSYCRQSGFVVVDFFRRFYFDARFARHSDGIVRPQPFVGALKNLAYRSFPGPLREGLTLVLRKGA